MNGTKREMKEEEGSDMVTVRLPGLRARSRRGGGCRPRARGSPAARSIRDETYALRTRVIDGRAPAVWRFALHRLQEPSDTALKPP